MIQGVSQKSKALGLYVQQSAVAERLHTFGNERKFTQTVKDQVNISRKGKELHTASRKRMTKEEPITYGNPRVDNPNLSPTYNAVNPVFALA